MELSVFSKNNDFEDKETTLMSNKPIAIKPAWKSSKIFEPHSVTYVSSQPIDKFNLIFIVLFLQGIGIFLPWNMFINAQSVSPIKLLDLISKLSTLMKLKLMLSMIIE
jgi:hypothetical protein